ncbi:MAG: hypothetical protein GY948_08010 [Alphaproteobacteria bacterium]|nr:hypothetical protein [Alphaproteobacteria bacterium]
MTNANPIGRDPGNGRFLAGNKGGGRPKGSRNKLGEQFIADLYAEWQEHGAEALTAMREEKPAEFVKVVASVMPKELHLKNDPFKDISDEELANMLEFVHEQLALLENGASAETEITH